jgi:hypothetical protein
MSFIEKGSIHRGVTFEGNDDAREGVGGKCEVVADHQTMCNPDLSAFHSRVQSPTLRLPLASAAGSADETRARDDSSEPTEKAIKLLPILNGYDAHHSLIRKDETGNIVTKSGEYCVRRAGDMVSLDAKTSGKERCAVTVYHDKDIYHHYFIGSGEKFQRIVPFQESFKHKVIWRTVDQPFDSIDEFVSHVQANPEVRPEKPGSAAQANSPREFGDDRLDAVNAKVRQLEIKEERSKRSSRTNQ